MQKQHLSYLCDAVVHQPAVCQALNKDGYFFIFYNYFLKLLQICKKLVSEITYDVSHGMLSLNA